jgi:hypothetical protein
MLTDVLPTVMPGGVQESTYLHTDIAIDEGK